MIKIKIKDGAIVENREAITPHINGLKDGEYFLYVHASGATVTETQGIIEWFRDIPPDYKDIHTMQSKMNYLASLMYDFTSVLGSSAFNKASKEVELEKRYALRKLHLKSNGTGTQDAQTQAKADVSEFAEIAAIADAEHDINQLQFQAVKSVFQAMVMHLSLLKSEKNYTDKGNEFPQEQYKH